MQITHTLPRNIARKVDKLKQMPEPVHALPEVAQRRLRAVEHMERFGLASAQHAFGVSRSTLYRWRKQLRDNQHDPRALIPRSRAPKRKRQSAVDKRVVRFVLHYRRKHPGASKETIKPELDAYCARHGVRTVSVSTRSRQGSCRRVAS